MLPTPSQAGAAQTTNTTKQSFSLDNSLTHHGMGYFHETGNISAFHIVNVTVRFGSVFHCRPRNH